MFENETSVDSTTYYCECSKDWNPLSSGVRRWGSSSMARRALGCMLKENVKTLGLKQERIHWTINAMALMYTIFSSVEAPGSAIVSVGVSDSLCCDTKEFRMLCGSYRYQRTKKVYADERQHGQWTFTAKGSQMLIIPRHDFTFCSLAMEKFSGVLSAQSNK